MIAYALLPNPQLASYRLRVDLPRKHLGVRSEVGCVGNPTFFYKQGMPNIARTLRAQGSEVVYDVVNDHFVGGQAKDYYAMSAAASIITCASDVMREAIERYTGRSAVVIDDPYENAEDEPACVGKEVLWFGHAANLGSLRPYVSGVEQLVICSNGTGVEWTQKNEASCLKGCAAVLMTGSNPGASSNRVVKALRAGRFVIAPTPCESWKQFKDYIWIGDVREGLAYAFNNREDVCNKIRAGQEYVRDRFSPETIGQKWSALFASISAPDTSIKKVGCESICP